ncbi:MAG: PAS domain S-box protein [Anaerolineae bacterium]|nr:PAS domain S-box protein [Anaerolineae bacterium]
MLWQFTPYIILSFTAAVISTALAIYAWRHRAIPGAGALAFLMLVIGEWSLASTLELAVVDLPGKIFWSKVQYLGIVALPVAWLAFAWLFTNQDKRLTRRSLILLSIIPVITLLLVWTNEVHGLIWVYTGLTTNGSSVVLDVAYGPWFWVQASFAYILLLLGTILLVQMLLRASHLYRLQVGILLFGVLAPWAANAIYLAGLTPVDPTPLAFALTGLALSWGVFRFRLLNVTPVLRRTIVDLMNDAIIALDTQNRIIDLNPAAQRLIGRNLAQTIGQPSASILADLIDPYQMLRDGHSEITLTQPNEPARHFDLNISPLQSRQNRLLGHLLVLRDITPRKQVEEQLRQLSRAVEQSPNIVIITNTNGNIEYVNPKFTQVTGYTAEEALGQNPRILKSGDMSPADYKHLWETIAAGHEWRGELHNRRKDGESYWASVSISPVRTAEGVITRFVGVQEDITARKQAEQALALARDQALEASRLKSQLLANVSHDLRTPLNAILGYAEMLQEGVYGPLPDKQCGAISEIIESTGQLLNFVNNLLGQAQIEAGKVKLNLASLSPAKLIEDVKSMLDVVARAKGLTLTADIAFNMPATIPGDLYWLRQILANLINNAIKFTEPPGSVHVYIFQPNETQWAMQVSDTGQGIPAEAQSYIFDAFRQVDGTVTRGHTGSGLGLSIVKELTTLMQGQITLESKVGEGSSFTVFLPLLSLEEKT